MNKFFGIILLSLIFTGCAKISPLSPELDQRLDNTEGQIEDIRNNQNGIMLELGKINNKNELSAQEMRDSQQGIINFQGDGFLIFIFALLTITMLLVLYYRVKYLQLEKTSDILAQQIALYNDTELEDKVFMAALNTNVEHNVYHKMLKNQIASGRFN